MTMYTLCGPILIEEQMGSFPYIKFQNESFEWKNITYFVTAK